MSSDSRQLRVFFANEEALRQLAIHANRPADKFKTLRVDLRSETPGGFLG